MPSRAAAEERRPGQPVAPHICFPTVASPNAARTTGLSRSLIKVPGSFLTPFRSYRDGSVPSLFP